MNTNASLQNETLFLMARISDTTCHMGAKALLIFELAKEESDLPPKWREKNRTPLYIGESLHDIELLSDAIFHCEKRLSEILCRVMEVAQ